jgi:hypothetical protein
MPAQKLVQAPGLGVTMSCRFDTKRQRYWNVRNAHRFGMAPTALLETGEVDEPTYLRECAKFDRITSAYKRIEVDLTDLDFPDSAWWAIGYGHGHGFGYVPYAHSRDFQVRFADHSRVALAGALRFLESLAPLPNGATPEECVQLADMQYVLDELLRPRDCVIDISRVVHHTGARKQNSFWRSVGHFLSGQGQSFMQPPANRRLIITHPDARDNEAWIKEKKWKSVRPFNVDEVLPAISKAARRAAILARQSDPFECFGEWFRIGTIMLGH